MSRTDLKQRKAGDVKQLMALSHKVTAPRKAALQRKNREEEGGAEGQRHLVAVIGGGGVVAVCRDHQPPGDGTTVPEKGRNELAGLMQQGRVDVVAVFAVATTQA